MRLPVVGFDLDLTLVDSTPSVSATLRSVSRTLGLPVDVPALVASLGPRLEDLLAGHLSSEDSYRFAAAYRELYTAEGHRHAVTLPGAHDALAAVRHRGWGVVVVTGQNERSARAQLAYAGLAVDDVAGSVWGPDKSDVLRAQRALAYIGDHPADIAAARGAGALAVGVTSGRHDASMLTGADTVLASLVEFPGYLSKVAGQYPEVPVRSRRASLRDL